MLSTEPPVRLDGRHPGRITAGLLLALLLAACGPSESPRSASARTYRSRGIVRQLPSEGSHPPEIRIRHEAIPEFTDIRGEVVGMDSMTMPFPVAQESSLEGVSAGDKVAFVLEVDWSAAVPVRVTALEVLPPDTPLDFESAD